MPNIAFAVVCINICTLEWVKQYELSQTFVFDINRIRLSCFFFQVLKYRVNNGYYSACFHTISSISFVVRDQGVDFPFKAFVTCFQGWHFGCFWGVTFCPCFSFPFRVRAEWICLIGFHTFYRQTVLVQHELQTLLLNVLVEKFLNFFVKTFFLDNP